MASQKICKATCIFTENIIFAQVFFKHFASKNQLPGLSVSGTLVENGLIDLDFQWTMSFNTDPSKQVQEVIFSQKPFIILHAPLTFNSNYFPN